MAVTAEVIEFSSSDRSALLVQLRRLDDRGDGTGWINLGPALSEEELARTPRPSGLGAWFSGRGPAVPMATWTAPTTTGRERPAQVGLAHGTGPNALERLADAGLALPRGWTKRQDHAKHGIVAELPPNADHDAMISWLLDAMVVLSPLHALGVQWIAEVHDPSASR